MQLTITRVLIRKCRHGIHLTNRNRNVAIADCHIYENRGIGVFLDAVNLHQTNVTGCHISYCDGGGIVCRAGEVRNLQVTGCDIESNQGEGRHRPRTSSSISTGGSNAEVAITGYTIQHNHNAAGSANIRVKGPSAQVIKGAEEHARRPRDHHRQRHQRREGERPPRPRPRRRHRPATRSGPAYEHNVLAEHSSFVTVGAEQLRPQPALRRRGETEHHQRHHLPRLLRLHAHRLHAVAHARPAGGGHAGEVRPVQRGEI